MLLRFQFCGIERGIFDLQHQHFVGLVAKTGLQHVARLVADVGHTRRLRFFRLLRLLFLLGLADLFHDQRLVTGGNFGSVVILDSFRLLDVGDGSFDGSFVVQVDQPGVVARQTIGSVEFFGAAFDTFEH